MKKAQTNEEKYPSVDLAYEIALKSYEISMRRSDVADDAIDKMRSWITTVTLAFVAWVITRETGKALFDLWLVVSTMTYFVIVALSIFAKHKGGLVVPAPKDLYNKYLHFAPWEFKKNFIYWAGEYFERNKKYVAEKSTYAIVMFILFLMEAVSLALWMMTLSH